MAHLVAYRNRTNISGQHSNERISVHGGRHPNVRIFGSFAGSSIRDDGFTLHAPTTQAEIISTPIQVQLHIGSLGADEPYEPRTVTKSRRVEFFHAEKVLKLSGCRLEVARFRILRIAIPILRRGH